MTELNQIYKCEVCGNMVEMVHGGKGQMICCGQPMVLLTANTKDASLEKHVPVVEKNGDEVVVKVGSIDHPMVEEHYIEWIEVITADKIYRKHLKPGEAPEAKFCISGDIVNVREYCNIHGLWQA